MEESGLRESSAKGSGRVVPIHKGDHSRLCNWSEGCISGRENGHTVVDIVHIRVRVIGVVDDHGPAKTVTVLGSQMAVVPIGARLVGNVEVVQERIAGSDGALVDKRGAVGPVGARLE